MTNFCQFSLGVHVIDLNGLIWITFTFGHNDGLEQTNLELLADLA